MKSTRNRRAPLWAGLALAAAVALTGCGNATPTGSAGGAGLGGPRDTGSAVVPPTDATATLTAPPDATATTEPTPPDATATTEPTPGSTAAPSAGPSTGGSSTGAGVEPPSANAAADTSAPRCHTSDLMVVIEGRGGAAGTLSAQILLTNHADHSCAVYGYGGMQLYAADGSKVPTDMVRDPATPPAQVVLNPGNHAYSALRWSDVPTGDEPSDAACEPQATIAHITPPDETDSLNAHWSGSPVCDHGRIDQGAYRAGSMPQQ